MSECLGSNPGSADCANVPLGVTGDGSMSWVPATRWGSRLLALALAQPWPLQGLGE